MIDGRGHEAGGYVYDCVYASLPEFERVNVPADVRYTVDPAQFVSDPASGLELAYDGAYWISGMEVADNSRTGSVLAFRSDGDDAGAYRIDHVDRRGESGPDGGDLCGPNPDVRTGDTWRERAVERNPVPSTGGADVIDVGMRNLAAVTVDLADGSLRDGGSITVVTDGPGEVTITGLDPGMMVTIGDESGEADADGSVTLAVVEGQTEGSIG
jgi:hypothetical protein